MATQANDPIARLRRIADSLPADCAEDAAWLTGALDAAIAGVPLKEALGLYLDWRADHRMRQQEPLIRELVARFGPMSSGEIATKINKFADGPQDWRPGSVEELLFYIVRAGKVPSARTVRRMLEAGHPVCSGGQPLELRIAS